MLNFTHDTRERKVETTFQDKAYGTLRGLGSCSNLPSEARVPERPRTYGFAEKSAPWPDLRSQRATDAKVQHEAPAKAVGNCQLLTASRAPCSRRIWCATALALCWRAA